MSNPTWLVLPIAEGETSHKSESALRLVSGPRRKTRRETKQVLTRGFEACGCLGDILEICSEWSKEMGGTPVYVREGTKDEAVLLLQHLW